jgi:hypothetical protein
MRQQEELDSFEMPPSSEENDENPPSVFNCNVPQDILIEESKN